MSTLAETTLPVDQNTVAHAMQWLESSGQALQWPPRTLFKLHLCLDETLTNVIMYGYDGARDTNDTPCVRLSLQQDGPRLTLVVMDNGMAFDPTAQAPRQLDESLDDAEIGGHGLRLMLHYLEDIRYERHEGWNRLELIAGLDDAG